MSLSNQAEPDLATAEPEPSRARGKPKPRVIDMIKAFVEHPTTRLVMALILILSGFIETLDTVKEDVSNLKIRVGHGIILLGFVNAFSSLPAVIDGIERWLRLQEAKSQRRRNEANPAAAEKPANAEVQS